jgi:hypothetical protein
MGAKHAWTGAVALAKDPDPAGRVKLKDDADNAWRAAWTGHRTATRRVSYPKKSAAVDAAVADLVAWLARDYRAGTEQSATSPGIRHEHRGNSPKVPDQRTTGPQEPYISPEHGVDGPPGARRHPEDQEDQKDPPELHTVVEQIEQFGDALTDKVALAVERAHHGPIPDATKVAMADHFWCDLLAHVAHAIDEGTKRISDLPDRVSELIIASRTEDERLPLEEFVVRTAVKATWSFLKNLTFLGSLDQVKRLLPMLRILGVLICKAPERHEAVMRYCVDPLTGQFLEETKKRLVKVLRSWLPLLGRSFPEDADFAHRRLPDPDAAQALISFR